MSEETGGRRSGGRGRRGDGDEPADDARPAVPSGRRRRDAAGARAGSSDAAETSASSAVSSGSSGGGTALKGAPTPSRTRSTTPTGSPLTRLRRFLREVVAELRKVHWPTRRQIVVYTFVVLVFVTFMVTLVYLLDLAFAKAVFAIFG